MVLYELHDIMLAIIDNLGDVDYFVHFFVN